MFYFIYPAIS